MSNSSNKKTVIFLLGWLDDMGLWRFVCSDPEAELPGLQVDLVRGAKFEEQVAKAFSDLLGDAAPSAPVVITHHVATVVKNDGHESDLFLGRVSTQNPTLPNMPTLPEILRKMAKNKNRIAYLKVMQLLAGMDQEKLYALELTEDLKDRLLEK